MSAHRRFRCASWLIARAVFAVPPDGGGAPQPGGDGTNGAGAGGTGGAGGAGAPPSGEGREPGAPPPRRRRRLWKSLAWAVAAPVLIVALVAGLLYGAATTERGTAWVWRAAVKVLGGQLAGTLDGGTIATGLRLRDVIWRGKDGTTFAIDRVSSQWALEIHERRPWRFVLDYLHVGDVDARIVPSATTEPSSPMTLPGDLRLPLALELRDVRVAKLTLRQGTSATEFSNFAFHGRSDGRHHEAAVEQLDTPYGAVNARAKLDGVRPFALSGELGYAGKVNNEDVQMNARLGGSLEALSAEIAASGMKLAGQAHVEAAPFAAVPLKRATLAFDHVNPQAFAPGAPFADLALRADLEPAQGGVKPFVPEAPAQAAASGAHGASAAPARGASAASARIASAGAPASASGAAPASATTFASGATGAAPGHENPNAAGFTVAGKVSIVNAKPGAIDAHLLP
ncbi:MAG: translocation and assembly module protein TamB, partial [Paraburkholderia sp.]|nr:translocation and assembly module protein TamB [Paraburkholderia sp.]